MRPTDSAEEPHLLPLIRNPSIFLAQETPFPLSETHVKQAWQALHLPRGLRRSTFPRQRSPGCRAYPLTSDRFLATVRRCRSTRYHACLCCSRALEACGEDASHRVGKVTERLARNLIDLVAVQARGSWDAVGNGMPIHFELGDRFLESGVRCFATGVSAAWVVPGRWRFPAVEPARGVFR